MDKSSFTALLRDYTRTSAEGANEVVALRDEYPYSQVLQALAARVARDHDMQEQAAWLTSAAVHAADRTVLKDIMTATADDENAQQTATTIQPIQSIGTTEDIDYADELMRDLQTLNTLKHNFELLLVEYSEVHATTPTPAESKTEPASPAPSTAPKEKKAGARSGKSKRQRIIEMAKAMNQAEGGADPKPAKTKSKTPPIDPPDALIEEIRTRNQELTPESRKQVEQLDLIDRFIQTQPSISSARDRVPPPSGDLNPVKSGEFGDNIVSETLVEILIKQGKKDKAIEVLKKLIWKYPQKKAYFATQIEDLKR